MGAPRHRCCEPGCSTWLPVAEPYCRLHQSKSRRGRSAARGYASREEQRARYLDCGPTAWDDRDGDGS